MSQMDSMTLGALIDALAQCDKTKDVMFDFCRFAPTGHVDSYRGYYSDLALSWAEACSTTVATLLAELRKADGATFQGYKGGDFRMTRDTPIWVANWGDCHGTAVVRVNDDNYYVILETAKVDP